MRIIKSLQNEQIKNFARLKEKKYRDEVGLFIVEGDHLVRMAIEANCLVTLLVAEEDLENYLDIKILNIPKSKEVELSDHKPLYIEVL